MGIVEDLMKDRPTNQKVTEQLESVESKMNDKIAACTLKSESAEVISYCTEKIKQEKEE